MRDSYKLLLLTLGGSLFAGYLAGDKLFNDNCTIGASCAYWLGYPTCYYGFALFATMLVLSTLFVLTNKRMYAKYISIVAMLGVIFSGYFSVVEIAPLVSAGALNLAGIPSCTYGLVGFIIALCIAYKNSEV